MRKQRGNGVAGFAFTREGRIKEWEGMKGCGQQSAKTKTMPDGNGQCKMAFRRPGSNKPR
jgi:hypothetical protein